MAYDIPEDQGVYKKMVQRVQMRMLRSSMWSDTKRQNWLSELAHTRTVYTPEFFVAGKEERDWGDKLGVSIKRVNATPARANIAISMGAPSTAGVPVQVSASAIAGAKLYVALVENGLASKVAAGENNGRVLHHDYVVREWSAPVTLGADGSAQLVRTLPIPPGAPASRYGVTAFVQTEQGAVLQALSLDACGPATSGGTGARKGG